MRQNQIKLDIVFKLIHTGLNMEKILYKIQSQINELAPALEVFIDETIQPSVKDCENLQGQLSVLQEQVAVYKYNQVNRELSPSFAIHSKVSSSEILDVKHENTEVLNTNPIKEIEAIAESPVFQNAELIVELPIQKVSTENSVKPIIIGLNDKFRFINDLFVKKADEYNLAIEQLNNLNTYNDCEIYLNSLKKLYGWKDDNEVVNLFYALVKKRF